MWCAPPLHSLGGPSRDLTDRCSVRHRGSDDVRPVWNRAPWLCRLPAATGHLRATLRRPYASARLGATPHASTRPFLGRARQGSRRRKCHRHSPAAARRHRARCRSQGLRTFGPRLRRSTPRRHHRPPRPRSLGPRDRDAAHLTRREAHMRANARSSSRSLAGSLPPVLGRTANHRRREPRTRCASRAGGRGSALRGHSFLMSLVVSLSTSRPTRLSQRLLRATHNRSLC